MKSFNKRFKCLVQTGIVFLLVTTYFQGILSSCSKDEEPSKFIPDTDCEIYFATSLDFETEGGEKSITFTTNKDWTIEMSQSGGSIDWCSISSMQGNAGHHTVKIRTEANISYDDRNVTLIFKVQEITRKIVVTQKQKNALTTTTAKYEIGVEGGLIQAEIKSNIAYNVVIPEEYKEWIHQKENTRSMSTSNLTFVIDPSKEYNKREGSIIIQGEELSETLKIYQAGSEILLLSQDKYTVSDKGEQIKVELNTNFEYEVSMPDVTWITETKTRGVSSHTLYYTISPNDTYDKREAKIVYFDKNSDVTATLRIVQMQKDAIIVAQNEYEVEYTKSTLTFDVQTNIDFAVDISADWVKQITTRGLETKLLSFEIDENTSDANREATITIYKGDLKQKIQLIQLRKPQLAFSETEHIATSDETDIEIGFNANIDYTIHMPEEANWLKHIETLSDGSSKMKFHISANDTYEERQATVILQNDKYAISTSIVIKQLQKDAIILSKNEYLIGSKGGELNFEILTNVDFNVMVNADWIKRQEANTKALRNESLHFDIAENSSQEVREATIVIQSEKIKQTISIRQEEKGNDREILMSIYKTNDGETWNRQTAKNWGTDSPIEQWSGVTVDTDGRVTALDFSRFGLTGKLYLKGLKKLTSLYCNESSLEGIEIDDCTNLDNIHVNCDILSLLNISTCSNLKTLIINSKDLTEVDLSKNIELTSFNCNLPLLSSLNLLNCIALTSLNITSSTLTSLDVSSLTSLSWLTVSCKQLTSLKVKGCTKLSSLLINDCSVKELDASGLPNLSELQCMDNEMTSLNVTGSLISYRLWCDNNNLTSLDISTCPEIGGLSCSGNLLTALDVSNLKKLEYLICYNNHLTTLKLAGCTNLENLDCSSNELSILDVSESPKANINCSENKLKQLNLNPTPGYKYLNCDKNELVTLDGSGFTNLQCNNNKLTNLKLDKYNFFLWCSYNELTELDCSMITEMGELNCSHNKLTSLDVTSIKAGFDGGIKCSDNQLKILKLNSALGLYCKNNPLEIIYMDKNMLGLKEYIEITPWGEVDIEKYIYPTYWESHQYPQFIYNE